jgi:hypothetical protein
MRSLLAVYALLCATGIAAADSAQPVEGAAADASAPVETVQDRPIEWNVPAECPLYVELVARVEARLGTDLPARAPRMRVIIRGKQGKLLVATVWQVLESGQGTEARTLSSEACEPLTDAVAVVIARVTRDQIAAQALPPPPEIEEPPAAAVITAFPASRRADPSPLPQERPSVAAYVPPPRSVADAALTPLGFGTRMLAVSGVGTVPGVGLGGELAVFARRRNMFGEVALTRWSKRASTGSLTTEPAAVGLDVIAARFGYVPSRTLLRAWAVTEVGRWSSPYEMPTRAHIAVGAGAAVAWPITDEVRVVGVFETTMTVVRNPFQASPGGPEVHRPSAGAARCSLGVEFGWW